MQPTVQPFVQLVSRPLRRARLLAVAALSTLLALPAWAQQDFSKVEIKTAPVAPGLWMLQGSGGNIGVSAGEDGVFLVDDQYAPLTDKIRAAVAALSDKPIRFVLNTHWHGDHTGGNENLGSTGTLIVAHDNVRVRMASEQFMRIFNRSFPASPRVALPVVTFPDRVTFHLNGEEVVAFHVLPSHTDGDSVVHFKRANALHLGDVYFNGGYPVIDVDTGGSIDGMVAVVDEMLALAADDTRIIPGHGPLSTRRELAAYRDMLDGVRRAVLPLVEAGKTLAEVQAAKPTAPWDEAWGERFMDPDRFLLGAYESLKKRK